MSLLLRAVHRLGLGMAGIVLFANQNLLAECIPSLVMPTQEQLQTLQVSAKDHGFLWKISKEGRSSWLYGSIHINRLSAAIPGPKTRQALQHSQTIALELDPNDPATLAKLQQLASQGAGQLPAALKPRLKVQMDKVCLPETIIPAIHPALLFSTLSVLGLREAGFEAAFGTENMLLARSAGKKIVALETAESQMQALIGDGKVSPAEYAEALVLLESNTEQAMTVKLLDAWAASDLFTLESFADWCDCMNTPKQRADMQRLNDERNPPMADSIAKLHSQAAPIFVAVGSLHMIGKNGLPALLAKRGFKVERVSFDN